MALAAFGFGRLSLKLYKGYRQYFYVDDSDAKSLKASHPTLHFMFKYLQPVLIVGFAFNALALVVGAIYYSYLWAKGV